MRIHFTPTFGHGVALVPRSRCACPCAVCRVSASPVSALNFTPTAEGVFTQTPTANSTPDGTVSFTQCGAPCSARAHVA
eukprot:6680758-Prymnesium_polylepis.1